MAKQPDKKGFDTFEWVGVSARGKRLEGEMTGASIALVKAQLRKQGITPSKVKRKAKPLFGVRMQAITPKDIALVTRQIATMLMAGVPLIQSIEMIGTGSTNKSVTKLMETVGDEVKAGGALSDALRKHPRYFDDLYCDLVASGEQSGALDKIFDRVALYKEKSEALKSKIKKAMFYPIAVLVVALIVTSILLIFVVPQFQDIFAGFGAELPAFTLMVIGISEFMQEYWWMMLIALVGFGWAYKEALLKSKKLRDANDRAILKLPVIGMILNKAAVARYARTLSTTFAAGVPLVDALDSAAGASGNAVYRYAILDIKAEVSSGNQMNWAMRNSKIFPDMVIQMVAIGEESGSLDGMLAKVATIYEQEVDDAVDGLSSLLEPLIMAVLGVLVGGLIIAMYLPIFQLGSVI
ncbi:MAG: type IV pilus assembly protein PilC [Pseudoalteromonas rhizosphaerae]|jgi:type IV pilus assembly protein PilC|uniref:Type II secretion system F family protein n=2 Tax=Pseudoalteromonas TaxID=53246 RepID=A0ABY3FFU7_9GAMM|nr:MULTISPECIES: type II secretion system F family protein [Pseudoalteromonas]MBB1419298.1 type II secretion system F family protein [Pseudoalteromonas sp. SG44-1]MBB1480730.1 type II secretion system F family protein [Pseudoalteromonas sp. SG41-2]NMM41122.1 type II secretion system F family protein [Pseudoalteromonas arctica]TVU84572.1 type II secretion system F family protein [Pseudoalteromonas neustonica]